MSEPDETEYLPDARFQFVFVKAWKFNIKSYRLETSGGASRWVEMWHVARITDEIADEYPVFRLHLAAFGEELALQPVTIGMN